MDYRPHRKLDVWKKSMGFVKDIYQATEQFPKSEIYGLTSQMRRASISIPSNSCPIKQLEEDVYYTYVLQSVKDTNYYTGFTKGLKL